MLKKRIELKKKMRANIIQNKLIISPNVNITNICFYSKYFYLIIIFILIIWLNLINKLNLI